MKESSLMPRLISFRKIKKGVWAQDYTKQTGVASSTMMNDVDHFATNWHAQQIRGTMHVYTCIPWQSLKHKKNMPWLTKNTTQHIKMWNAAF